MAKKYHCAGVQFRYGLFDSELIRCCHEANLFCNVFFADTAEGYKNYFDMCALWTPKAFVTVYAVSDMRYQPKE